MKNISVSSFKENCLAIVDEVHAKREPVIITKHGKATAKLIPVGAAVDEIYNFLVGKGAITGDVLSSAIQVVLILHSESPFSGESGTPIFERR
jgi:prevent-host-death family protein